MNETNTSARVWYEWLIFIKSLLSREIMINVQ